VRRLLFADVHANLPALEAVLKAAGSWDEAWFLGDIVGWGPYPAPCVALLRQTGARCIAGNHDRAVSALQPGAPGNFVWDEWTRARLDDDQLAFLRGLEDSFQHRNGSGVTTCLHQQPGGGYLHPQISAEDMALAFPGVKGDRVLCAHSHHLIERSAAGRYYCCLRAVGQTRDADPRAGYAIEVDGEIRHHRVEYDVSALVREVETVGLPPDLAARWARFVSTGYDPQWSRMEGK
jgi:hypothetical protein